MADLLPAFMDIDKISNDKLHWNVIIHTTFIFSALLLGNFDKLVFATRRK